MIVLGLDTGLAALGWALVDTEAPSDISILRAGVWTTEREAKKRQLHVGSDDARRVDFLADQLLSMLETHEPELVAYELPGGAARGYRAAHALGMAHALVRAVLRANRRFPVVEVTAFDVKLTLTGDRKAKKSDMIRAAEERGQSPFREVKVTDLEHAADAVGVALAGALTEVGKAIRAARRPPARRTTRSRRSS